MFAEGTIKVGGSPKISWLFYPAWFLNSLGPLYSLHLTSFSFNPVALQCPAHSRFSDCLPPCPPSCSDPDSHCEGISPKAHSDCKEGCMCQPGYVLHNDKCVLKIECGCQDTQGGFIPVSWYRKWV